MIGDYIGIFILISLIFCLVGFYKQEYFATIGYGFSVAGIGVAIVVLKFMKAYDASWPHYVLFALVILYGLFRATISLAQELEGDTYKQKGKKAPIYLKIVAWLVVGLLSVGLVSPVFFTVYNYGYPGACVWLGIILGTIGVVYGILLEIPKIRKVLSDWPKCVGEIIFWTGIFLSSVDVLDGAMQWIVSVVAYVCIVAIRGLEIYRSNKKK